MNNYEAIKTYLAAKGYEGIELDSLTLEVMRKIEAVQAKPQEPVNPNTGIVQRFPNGRWN